MQLKVGDKVRWIGDESYRTKGTVGKVTDFADTITYIRWEDRPAESSYTPGFIATNIIKEFQPGDRVVYQGKQEGLRGHLGTVVLIEHGNPYDFIAKLDDYPATALGCKYSENVFAHAPSDPAPATARTPTLPPPPPEPHRPPERSQYGRCYFCGCPDSEWLRDRYTCDDCMVWKGIDDH